MKCLIISCAKVIPLRLKTYPNASFCFAASRSVDVRNSTIEGYGQTQRFRLYQYMIPLNMEIMTLTEALIKYILLFRAKDVY